MTSGGESAGPSKRTSSEPSRDWYWRFDPLAHGYEANGSMPWRHVAASFRLRDPEVSRGSRGWGFWNGSMDQAASQLAWFMYVQGSGGTVGDGFYAVTQVGSTIDSFLITGVDLAAWNHVLQDPGPSSIELDYIRVEE
jgi:hypothetical protein